MTWTACLHCLRIPGTEGNKATDEALIRARPFWHSRKDFLPDVSALILERTRSSISVKSSSCRCQLTGNILLSCYIYSREFRYYFDRKPIHQSSCALFVFSPVFPLFSWTKTPPLSAKPGGDCLTLSLHKNVRGESVREWKWDCVFSRGLEEWKEEVGMNVRNTHA